MIGAKTLFQSLQTVPTHQSMVTLASIRDFIEDPTRIPYPVLCVIVFLFFTIVVGGGFWLLFAILRRINIGRSLNSEQSAVSPAVSITILGILLVVCLVSLVISPSWVGFAAGVSVLILQFCLARKADDNFSWNGIGTALYGKKRTTNGYISTKWLTILYVPVLPVRSYLVLGYTAGDDIILSFLISSKRYYHIRRLPRLFWPHVWIYSLITALFGAAFLALCWNSHIKP